MRKRLVLLGVLTIPTSCGGPENQSFGPLPPENGPYVVDGVKHRGSVRGMCRLVGEAHPARLAAWPGMGTEAGQDDESVSSGPGQALGGCFVALAGIARGKDWPAPMRSEDRRFMLTVKPGRYEPHVAWVRTGTQVDFRSEIPMAISVRMLHSHRGTIANLSVSPGTTLTDVAMAFLSSPGFVQVTEDVRRAFNAWLLVSPHPYVEITSAESTAERGAGEYRLDDVPVGDYEVVCRHEPMDRREVRLPGRAVHYEAGPFVEVRRRVRVDADATVTLDFDVFSPAPSAGEPLPR